MHSRDENHTIKNRMDEETAEFYDRVRTAYGDRRTKPQRFRVIEAWQVEEIHANVVEMVSKLLN